MGHVLAPCLSWSFPLTVLIIIPEPRRNLASLILAFLRIQIQVMIMRRFLVGRGGRESIWKGSAFLSRFGGYFCLSVRKDEEKSFRHGFLFPSDIAALVSSCHSCLVVRLTISCLSHISVVLDG